MDIGQSAYVLTSPRSSKIAFDYQQHSEMAPYDCSLLWGKESATDLSVVDGRSSTAGVVTRPSTRGWSAASYLSRLFLNVHTNVG